MTGHVRPSLPFSAVAERWQLGVERAEAEGLHMGRKMLWASSSAACSLVRPVEKVELEAGARAAASPDRR